MKNKPEMINQRVQSNNLTWLYQEEGDDFLSGKTPSNIPYSWEDEE